MLLYSFMPTMPTHSDLEEFHTGFNQETCHSCVTLCHTRSPPSVHHLR